MNYLFRDYAIHKKIAPFFDQLFLLRPTLFFPVWIMIAVGMAAATASLNNSIYSILIINIDLDTIALFLGMTFISGASFIINQVKDKDSDELNNKLFLVGNYISIEKAQRIMYGTLVIGLVLMLYAGTISFVLGILLFLFGGILYNIEPFHLKKKPVLGMITNSIAGFIFYVSGWMLVYHSAGYSLLETLSSPMTFIAIPYILGYTATSLLTTIPDIEGDRKTGANTFSLKYGMRRTIVVGAIMALFGFSLGLILGDMLSLTANLVSLPFYIIAIIRVTKAEVLRTIRYSVLILALFVMVVYPLLFPAVFITFYLSKYYYWHRFNLNYPTFNVSDK